MARRRFDSLTGTGDQRAPTPGPSSFSATSPTSSSTYSHVSLYHSPRMQLQLYSPCVKAYQDNADEGPLAVFSNHDHVSGKIILDRSCYHTGRLSISIEGAFTHSASLVHIEGDKAPECSQPPKKRKHIFFSSSTVIPVSVGPDLSSPRSAFREAFMRRRPSASSLNLNVSAIDKHFPFKFELPRGCRPGEEMPPSFSASQDEPGALNVTYKIKAVWEAAVALEAPSVLEVPILYYPDHDFQSVDASPQTPQSWLEMPLRSDRPMPFRCAVTLPTSVTFTRSSSIPYFVVFTTTPRSPELAREIAADATISVSLLRQVNVTEQVTALPTPPQTPSSSSEELDSPRNKLLKRVGRGQSKTARAPGLTPSPEVQDKPLPRLPNQTFTETTTQRTSICIGFRKRPRHQLTDGRGHPTLESQAALPDGLHKDKILIQKDMLPCIDWAGLSVKYYLDVSVLVGQDDFRARIPVRII